MMDVVRIVGVEYTLTDEAWAQYSAALGGDSQPAPQGDDAPAVEPQ